MFSVGGGRLLPSSCSGMAARGSPSPAGPGEHVSRCVRPPWALPHSRDSWPRSPHRSAFPVPRALLPSLEEVTGRISGPFLKNRPQVVAYKPLPASAWSSGPLGVTAESQSRMRTFSVTAGSAVPGYRIPHCWNPRTHAHGARLPRSSARLPRSDRGFLLQPQALRPGLPFHRCSSPSRSLKVITWGPPGS